METLKRFIFKLLKIGLPLFTLCILLNFNKYSIYYATLGIFITIVSFISQEYRKKKHP